VGTLALGVQGWRYGALLPIGALLGMSLYHAAFGFTSAYRSAILHRDVAGAVAQLVMLGLAMLLFAPVLARGEVFGHGVVGNDLGMRFDPIYASEIPQMEYDPDQAKSLLRQAGLPDALKAAAQRSAGPVTVQAEDVGRPGPDVEAALYFCVLEALQNVAKHAPDASVAVRLVTDRDSGDLVLAVADDGPGFVRQGDSAGQGQQNMVDRMGAVGGSVTWTSTPGSGTTVELRLPPPDRSP